MIEIKSETLIRLAEVPNHLPKRRGRKVHIASVYRWVKAGLSGVRLETVYVGGAQFTSHEALDRFAQQLTAVKTGIVIKPATSKRAMAAHGAAKRKLDAMGI
jgi:hypothetical protein